VEVQKQIQRAGGRKRLTADEIAAGIWDSLADDEKCPPLGEWLKSLEAPTETVIIPDGKPEALGKDHLFAPGDVDFLQGTTVRHETYAHAGQAALVALLAGLEVRGRVEVPRAEDDCERWRGAVEAHLADARARFEALAEARTGPHALRDATVNLLVQWFLHGRA
jgi:hypothetical protein